MRTNLKIISSLSSNLTMISSMRKNLTMHCDDDEGVPVNKMRFLCVVQPASILILSHGL